MSRPAAPSPGTKASSPGPGGRGGAEGQWPPRAPHPSSACRRPEPTCLRAWRGCWRARGTACSERSRSLHCPPLAFALAVPSTWIALPFTAGCPHHLATQRPPPQSLPPSSRPLQQNSKTGDYTLHLTTRVSDNILPGTGPRQSRPPLEEMEGGGGGELSWTLELNLTGQASF